MTLTEYRNYKKGMEELAGSNLQFFARYRHELYPFNFIYICGELTNKEVYDNIFKRFGKGSEEHCQTLADGITKYTGTCYSYDSGTFAMKVPNIMHSSGGIERIVHEAMHGTVNFAEWIGLRLSLEGQEAWCYLIDDIVEKYFIFQNDAIEYYLKHKKQPKIIQLSYN